MKKILLKSESKVAPLDKIFFIQVLFGIPYDAVFTAYGMHLANDVSAFFKVEEGARQEKSYFMAEHMTENEDAAKWTREDGCPSYVR